MNKSSKKVIPNYMKAENELNLKKGELIMTFSPTQSVGELNPKRD